MPLVGWAKAWCGAIEKGSRAVDGEAIVEVGRLFEAAVAGEARTGGLPIDRIAGSTKADLGCCVCSGGADACCDNEG